MSTLGIIEGFYGEPWGWPTRHEALAFMREWKYAFYVYAPKSDLRLRKEWRQPHEEADAAALVEFGSACKEAGVSWGVGLTPLGLHEAWDGAGRSDLRKRLRSLAELGMDRLAVLFDDMPGDFPELARTQGDILKFVADHDVAPELMMCPTYYSDTELLDRLFGLRPEGYLEDLGAALDDGVQVCWTGPEVCSKRYEIEPLQRVSEQLGRQPLIWDNYPVNDGPRMCRFLHLRAPYRPAEVLERVSGVMVNPMNQYHLSRVPMIAMSRSLRGETPPDMDPVTATHEAMQLALPPALADPLGKDWMRFQERGLDELDEGEKAECIARYRAFEHPAARELVEWLQGRSVVSADILTDV